MGVAGIAAAVGAAAALASTAYSLSQSPPNLNQGNAQQAGVLAAAEMLPWQRMYESAAQQGTAVTRYGYRQVTYSDEQRQQIQSQLDHLNQQIQAAQLQAQQQQQSGIPGQQNAQQGALSQWWLGQLRQQQSQLQTQLSSIPQGGGTVYLNAQNQVVPRTEAVVDFSGMGRAEVQAELARQMAGVQLGLQQKYGVQFANEARQQMAQADPEGTAARAEEYNLIQKQINATPDRPVANLLDQQVSQQLASGNKLDPTARAMLDQAVGQAMSERGGDSGADTQMFATPLETGFEGQQRQLAAQQKAAGWLASGSTPEDVAYRRQQQNMANLGAFINGQSPEAQFRNLSGAQQGSTPFNPGQPLSLMPGDAAQTGLGYATSGWLQNMRYQQSQANPWMAGLSGLLGLGNAAAGAGWQPFANSSGSTGN